MCPVTCCINRPPQLSAISVSLSVAPNIKSARWPRCLTAKNTATASANNEIFSERKLEGNFPGKFVSSIHSLAKSISDLLLILKPNLELVSSDTIYMCSLEMFRLQQEKIRKRRQLWFLFSIDWNDSRVFDSMADALSVIPPAVLRNLSDRLYEKRKNAALEVLFLHSLEFSISFVSHFFSWSSF